VEQSVVQWEEQIWYQGRWVGRRQRQEGQEEAGEQAKRGRKERL
jgi:hypothetical protein